MCGLDNKKAYDIFTANAARELSTRSSYCLALVVPKVPEAADGPNK